jgi:hypothetical protein
MNELISELEGQLHRLATEIDNISSLAARKSGPAKELGMEEVSDFLFILAARGRELEDAIISFRGMLANAPNMPF